MSNRKTFIPVISQGAPYWKRSRALFGSSLISYFPLWDKTGVTASEIISGYNGTHRNTAGALVGVELNQAGIGDGKTATLYTGTGYTDIYTSGLAAAFTPLSGGVLLWWKPNSSIWSDATARYIFELRVDTQNFIDIYSAGNGEIIWRYRAGNTDKTITLASQNWTSYKTIGITWNKTGNQMIGYLDGAVVGSPVTGLGTWVGNLSANSTLIGASSKTPNGSMKATYAHMQILNRPFTLPEFQKFGNYT